MSSYKHTKTCWKSTTRKTEKSWGSEYSWGALNGVYGKLIYMEKGSSSSLKYYNKKDEVLLVKNGKIRVVWGDENARDKENAWPEYYNITEVKAGEVFYIQSGCPYRVSALKDSEILELGNSMESPIKIFEEKE